MSNYEIQPAQFHSPAWVALTKIQFGLAASALGLGLWYVPVGPWIRAYFVMATMLLLSSAVALTKTLRDVHEGGRFLSRVEEAKLERVLATHDPLQA